MKRIYILFTVLGLVACPKTPSGTSPVPETDASPWDAEDAEEADNGLPAGWPSVDIPVGYRNLRVGTTLVRDDGSVWAGGSATKIGQYQWILRIPAFGDPTHTIFDLGRIQHLADNGTAGAHAVGVLGGVPQDKGWYGDIDAYGNIGDKQTYLSDADGALLGVTRIEGGIAYVGYQVTSSGETGWLVSADSYGRDRWKRTYGDATLQRLNWVEARGDRLVSVGTIGDASDMDAWLLVVDALGEPQLERRWEGSGHTALTSAIFTEQGDLIGAGLLQQNTDDYLEGMASAWLVRVSPEGETRWDRSERSDLSAVGPLRKHGSSFALAAIRGALGTDREVVVGQLDASGSVTWTEVEGSAGATWADVLTSEDGMLKVVMLATSESGVAWRFAEVQ